MKMVVKITFLFISFLFFSYVLLPNPVFPTPPPDSLQSFEPADTETPLRRSYFTNLTREEVTEHYENEFKFGNTILPPTYRLNYPPEEAKRVIREQTRSTFLEEIVHPLRESLFVNGFEPKEEKDAINIQGKLWRQKITIRFVPSDWYTRFIIAFLTLVFGLILFREWLISFKNLRNA
ncbi:hypothetical protein A2686_03175 [Candidatus Woesebacteria bacterium RIFCSPHIGHO2_01_FULL_38_10]|uniref:Uncharacterized protein n=1 Tax=Candidatus Woesebacteria bacterium RIFCSPLOWO2_01_FULL_39_10b TaxID=1802517 RepID=A0A1F8B5V2_9BACT|nr:MAG: hypothetical protein A2686_03175 [Candidatus Woesebacteria bacterium RIFCSPHIGHO2_01_FULL_38_10]OGM59290.1 MAG: hypothetical protein A2892_05510 [Candidatus Woesebacteria bacterium RIFCSPLOWO2_01_FULL_39_10b]